MMNAHEDRFNDGHANPLIEANQQLVLAMLRAQGDLTLAVKALDLVSRTAERDTLTELPNRTLFLGRFMQAITHAHRNGGHIALLFLDLDHFKMINDTHGHLVGDRVLKRTANCLVSAVREADTVSRHGGDEFLILLTDITHASDAAAAARKIIAALAQAAFLGDGLPNLTASIGISVYPEDGEDADTLIHRADMAMYRIKKQMRGHFVFHADPVLGVTKMDAPMPPPPQVHHSHAPWEDADHGLRHEQLRLANQQLVSAASSAEQLRIATDRAQRRQTEFLTTLTQRLGESLALIREAAAMLHPSQPEPELPDLAQVRAMLERRLDHASQLLENFQDMQRLYPRKP
ncbi:GGDEF domain-containing protein [Thiomonas sp. X19]|uniref:GGDEF domain-containing protein n=1 Tax=Thiomonas sp. X19 TaxID=1050370 RepID=UPI001313E3EE|nr:GGDEF domain-containing protein [Thiomonas sp. X19]